MSLDEIEVAKLRWETKEQFRLSNLPPWEQPDAPETLDENEEDSSQAPEYEDDDEELAVYIGGDCV